MGIKCHRLRAKTTDIKIKMGEKITSLVIVSVGPHGLTTCDGPFNVMTDARSSRLFFLIFKGIKGNDIIDT